MRYILAILVLCVPSSAFAQRVVGPLSNEACATLPTPSQLTAAWDPSPSSVTGYQLSIGNSPGVYGQVVDVGNVLSYLVGTNVSGTYCVAAASYALAAPAPQPSPSPNGTYAPSIVDCAGVPWTMGSARQTLRSGVWFSNGLADKYLLLSCVVYVDAGAAGWFRSSFNPDAWTYLSAGDPRGSTGTPPPPPPLPQPNTLTVAPKTCTISDTKPDARTGWGVQFAVDGVNVGGRDTGSPYSRDFPYTPGPHVHTATWTKTNVAAVTRTVTTQGCQ